MNPDHSADSFGKTIPVVLDGVEAGRVEVDAVLP